MKTNNDALKAKKKLLIIGGGYAGFWSAMSAIRQSREISKDDQLDVTLVNADNYFTMRPRLYEVSLEGLRVRLNDYLEPLGINQIVGKADFIHPDQNEVVVSTAHGIRHIRYDYLILASGSSLKAQNLPGIENTFNIDTFDNAKRLEDHIIALSKRNFERTGDDAVVVAGAGLTGLEAVTSIADKIRKFQMLYSTKEKAVKVILVERNEILGAYYSEQARAYLNDSVSAKKIQVITASELLWVSPEKAGLSNSVQIDTATVIWTVGMVASPLTNFFQGNRDALNRIQVNEYLKLDGYSNVIIAGDVANVKVGEDQTAVMSCQFSQWQGRWAGHNAVNDLFDAGLIPYVQNGYNTCLDLGGDDALITDGWDRILHKTGSAAKAHKTWICTDLIYPSKNVEEAVAQSFPKIPSF